MAMDHYDMSAALEHFLMIGNYVTKSNLIIHKLIKLYLDFHAYFHFGSNS